MNRIAASLTTVIGSLLVLQHANADRIIQRPSGLFYIVSNMEASQTFDRNSSGFFALAPTKNHPTQKSTVRNTAKNQVVKNKQMETAEKCLPVSCPAVPVTTDKKTAPSESIYLRLENKK